MLGNLIGTKKDGMRALGNGSDGVENLGSSKNFVGNGTSKGANTIAFNEEDGVRIFASRDDPNESNGNRILTNSIFSNPSGNEGKKFIGQKKVTTDASGNVSLTKVLPKVAVGKSITATGPGGNTSEFSAPRKVVA